MSRARYVLYRVAQSVFMVWFIVTFLFFFFRMLPGQYSDILIAQGASPESVAKFRAQWGLDEPLYVQYGKYMANLVQLKLGDSFQTRAPVWKFIHMKIFNTAILVAPAITFAYLFGSGYGALAGVKRGSLFERFGLIPLIFFGAFPAFFTAIFLIVIFSGTLEWFPVAGMISYSVKIEMADRAWWAPYLSKSFAEHYVLPFVAVVLVQAFLPALIMRTSIVEVKGQGFSFYHRMKGLPRSNRILHLIKHGSLPVITLFPISLTRAIGGQVLIETVFNWPGIGAALVGAILARDFPVVQGVFFLIAVFVVFGNLLVDLIYGVIDPRISLGD